MAGTGPGRPERILPEPEDFDPEEVAAKGADGLLAEGAASFDAGRYHAAHEAFEKVWLASEAGDGEFFKGLVQVAICLHQLDRGLVEGARQLRTGARRYLAAFLPEHRGLDVARLLEDLDAYLRPVLRARAGERPELDPALRPRMHRARR